MEVEEATIEKQSKNKEEKEGSFLLGPPTFADLGNGRFKCMDTGHELPAKEKESYARSKACRVALIDATLANNKPPLNMFQQCPLSKSKLVCKLTGDTINKTEEHIWKHMSGKRFQNKLEQKEMEKLASPEKVVKKSKKLPKSIIDAMEDDQKIKTDENASLEPNHAEKDSDPQELGFWTPPVGERWDFDDGKDRWESGTTSENDEEDGLGDTKASSFAIALGEKKQDPIVAPSHLASFSIPFDPSRLKSEEGNKQCEIESMELSMRTKRMSLAVGPSSFASRKKKKKTTSATHSNDSCDDL